MFTKTLLATAVAAIISAGAMALSTGSACSIAIGTGVTDTAPGTVNCQLVVADIHAARAELNARGLDVGEVQTFDWGLFVFFADPDGNRWAVQEIQRK